MPQTAEKFAHVDPVWSNVRSEALEMATHEPVLASFLHASVLNHKRFEDALSYLLAQKLGNMEVSSMLLRQVFDEAFHKDGEIGAAVRADVMAVLDRDPACQSYLEPLLYFKGFHALQAHRVAHWLLGQDRKPMAQFIQNRVSVTFGADINPAARIGRGIMIDHATGVVVGETAVIEDDVSLLQGVTLGGTGNEEGDRHPKIRRGAMIGAGAVILGNIEVGECSRVGASSVVLKDVPPCTTVAGIPARVVGEAGCDQPSRKMDQIFDGTKGGDGALPTGLGEGSGR
jgi:serine O-acetyltransferase